MPPDYPPNHAALPRSRVAEVIERGQEDALRQLRQAGIPETEALLVMHRFNVFAIQVIRELDLLYREFEQLLANDPNRSQAHQEWLDTKVGGMLLTIESFIAALVAEAINKAKEDYRNELAKPRDVITTVPASPRPTVWEQTLADLRRLVHHPAVRWSVGLSVWFVVWLLVTQSLIWALVAIGITAFVVWLLGKAGLVLIALAGVLCLLMLL